MRDGAGEPGKEREEQDMLYIETDKYQASHVHKPRGWGLWLFELHYADGRTERRDCTGTYATAARTVRGFADFREACRVYVLP